MEITEATRRCKAVVEAIENLPLSKITASCKSTLLRLANSELHFLSRLSLSLSLSPSPASSSFSCNVGYIEAIVHVLQQPYVTGVSRVCKPVPLSSAASCREKIDQRREAVHIDIVCSLYKSPAWFVVSDRNPKYISWDRSGKNKGLRRRIEQIINVVQSVQALKPAFIVLFFANGLEKVIHEQLINEFRFRRFELDFLHFEFAFADEIEGEWINILAKSYQHACTLILDVAQYPEPCRSIDYVVELSSSRIHKEFTENNESSLGFSFSSLLLEMKEWTLDVNDIQSGGRDLLRDDDLVNFDTTALIAIVSGISNGGAKKLLATPEDQLRLRFKNNTEFVISQARSEIESPLFAELSCILSAKRGIACETVHSEFMELVSMCGGPNERMRADQLVAHLKIVRDSPSPRMMCLTSTRKLASKNKVAFGTGDCWHASTLTANMGFVRAVSQCGMSLFTIEHRPRALVGD